MLMALLSYSTIASAALHILFLNGISGNVEKSTNSVASIRNIINEAGFSDRFVGAQYGRLFNPNDGFVEDNFELNVQANLSTWAIEDAKRLDPSAKMGGSLYKAFLGKTYYDGITTIYDDYPTQRDRIFGLVKSYAGQIDALLKDGHQVIVVSHSQGNFHAEAIDAYLRYGKPQVESKLYDQNLRFVGAASVAASTPNGRYVSLFEDLALVAHRTLRANVDYDILPPNIAMCLVGTFCPFNPAALAAIDPSIHGFVEIYTAIPLYGTELLTGNVVAPFRVLANMIEASRAELQSAGLIAKYTFDDCSANDSSGSGRHGTKTGTACVAGLHGNALKFNNPGFNTSFGNDWVELPLHPTNAVTFSAWVKWGGDAISGDGFAGAIWSLGTHTTDSFMSIWVNEGSGRIWTDNYTASPYKLVPGVWTMLTITSDGTTESLYMNGQLLSSYQHVAVNGFTGKTGYISRHFWANGQSAARFRGVMDDVYIYGRALSSTEVQNLYLATKTQSPARGTTNPANGHRYEVIDCGNWDQCRAAASGLGGKLATIRNQAEQNWIVANMLPLASTKWGFWIGLNDRAQDGVWVWDSGDQSTFRAWSSWYNPNPNNEDAAHMAGYFGGLWNDDLSGDLLFGQALVEYIN